MKICMYDSLTECSKNCTGCKAAESGCSNCGRIDSGYLYDSGKGLLCGDCLMNEMGQEYNEEFASVYKDEFRQFFLESNEDIRIAAE